MDFAFTRGQEDFRQEVRSFLEDEIKRGLWKPICDSWIMGYSPEFSKRIAAKGWIGLHWPKEYGGKGFSAIHRLVLTEEILRYGAPAACHWTADRQVGGAILTYGTEEQKKQFLPVLLRAQAFVGLGLSEPQAGSDLSSLQTKAVEDGNDYVLNGQKIWTTGGAHINWIYLVARTDPAAPKAKGISEFFFEANRPGITIRPIVDITGDAHFNEVFFDNVSVSKMSLIGQKNKGFYQVLHQLDYERSGMERLMGNYPLFEALIEFCKETKRRGRSLSPDPVIRDRLAQLKVEFEIGRLHMYRVALAIDAGRAPNWESCMSKVYGTTFQKHLAATAIQILSQYGQLHQDSAWAAIDGMASASYLSSQGYSLQAGTTEILKNVLAQRKLELPAQ